jgi:flavin-dependent dehydrogenase
MCVAIIGGGLAGLISGIELSKKGVPCILFERKKYPMHRVCGEYVSNETLPYLKSLDLHPEGLNPTQVTRFQLSSIRGQFATMPLDLGGFGISRFAFDQYLYREAEKLGVIFRTGTEVTKTDFAANKFILKTDSGEHEADVVIGAYGKRSKLDMALDRNFIKKRSPYLGVKYHLLTDHARDLIALHNFEGGYCGVVGVENNVTNVCYLAEKKVLQRYGNVEEMEREVLHKNPLLKDVFLNSESLYEKPLVINEISFATKSPVEDHILMAGDSAGMITPLCGNGMAMAIHSAKIVSELVWNFAQKNITRAELETQYARTWNAQFAFRLKTGRTIQRFFGNRTLSAFTVKLAVNSSFISKLIIRNTHGEVF